MVAAKLESRTVGRWTDERFRRLAPREVSPTSPGSRSRTDKSWFLAEPGSETRSIGPGSGSPDESRRRPGEVPGVRVAHLRSAADRSAACGVRASSWQRVDRRRRATSEVACCPDCVTRIPEAAHWSPVRREPVVSAEQQPSWPLYLTALGQSTELSAETRRAYVSRVGNYLRWLGDRKPSTDTLREFSLDLRSQGKSARTVNAYLTAVANFHRYTGPSVQRPTPQATIESLPEVLRPAEVEQLRTTLSVWTSLRDQTILRLLLGVGLRAGELCALNRRDVVAAPGGVQLTLPARDRPASRSPRDSVHRPGPTDSAEASAPSSGQVTRVFRLPGSEFRHLIHAASLRSAPDQPVFVDNEGKRLSCRAMAMVVQRAGIASGLVGLTPRILRHTAIADRLTSERAAQFALVADIGPGRRSGLIKAMTGALGVRADLGRAALRSATDQAGAPTSTVTTASELIRTEAARLLTGLVRPEPHGWATGASSSAGQTSDRISHDDDLQRRLIGQLFAALPVESGADYVARLERFVWQSSLELDLIYHRLYRRPGTALLSHDPVALVVFERFEAEPRLLYEVWGRSLPTKDLDDLAAIWRLARRLRHRHRASR